jgi:hypothetical protein
MNEEMPLFDLRTFGFSTLKNATLIAEKTSKPAGTGLKSSVNAGLDRSINYMQTRIFRSLQNCLSADDNGFNLSNVLTIDNDQIGNPS